MTGSETPAVDETTVRGHVDAALAAIAAATSSAEL